MKLIQKIVMSVAAAAVIVAGSGAPVFAAPSSTSTNSSTTITLDRKDLNLTGAPKEIGKNQIEGILNTVYGVVGIIAVISILIGALRYASANGDSGIIQSAKNTILYSVIGLVVVISAAAVTSFVINNIGKAS